MPELEKGSDERVTGEAGRTDFIGLPGDDSDRDFDRVPTGDEPLTAAAAAEADAIEAAAQANAARARKVLQAELEARRAEAARAAGGLEAAVEPEGPLAAAPFRPKRGQERWPVKTVTEDDGNGVNAMIQDTTIEDLWLLERPADMPLTRPVMRFQSRRAGPAETTLWRIEGRIIAHKWEKDGDFHIVIQSLTTGRTMIVEAPQEGKGSDGQLFVDDTSPFKARIEEARAALRERLQPAPFFNSESVRARITGVGFFDILHGQSGAATTNAIELHPVIAVEFLE
jgi:hypothetical protein